MNQGSDSQWGLYHETSEVGGVGRAMGQRKGVRAWFLCVIDQSRREESAGGSVRAEGEKSASGLPRSVKVDLGAWRSLRGGQIGWLLFGPISVGMER